MIIYHVPEADAGERWLPTLAKAGACAKAYKGTIHEKHAGEDGRDGMCAMLNEAEMTIGERGGDESVPTLPPEERPAIPLKPDAMSLTDVEEFIQNADLAQMASLSQNVCFRMKELLKPRAVND